MTPTPRIREESLRRLLQAREEPHLQPRVGIYQLSVPWPWSWAVVERGCPVLFFDKTWMAGTMKRRRSLPAPDEMVGAFVALVATTPTDAEGAAWLERRGLKWPSCPEEWRGKAVALARLVDCVHALRMPWHGPEAAWWQGRGAWGWVLTDVCPIEPLWLPPPDGLLLPDVASDVPPDWIPDLRERWETARSGVYRYEPFLPSVRAGQPR